MKILLPSKKAYINTNIFCLTISIFLIIDIYYAFGVGTWFYIFLVFLVLLYVLVAYYSKSYVKINDVAIEQRLLFFTESVPLKLVHKFELLPNKNGGTLIISKIDKTTLKIEMDMWEGRENQEEFVEKLKNIVNSD